jgi:hypothetical protein
MDARVECKWCGQPGMIDPGLLPARIKCLSCNRVWMAKPPQIASGPGVIEVAPQAAQAAIPSAAGVAPRRAELPVGLALVATAIVSYGLGALHSGQPLEASPPPVVDADLAWVGRAPAAPRAHRPAPAAPVSPVGEIQAQPTDSPRAPQPPQPAGGPWDIWFRGTLTAEPTFIDPPVQERLNILVNMLYAYNGLSPRNALPGRGRKHLAIPTEEKFRAWFRRLSPREKVALDWRFNDRDRYLAMFREHVKRWKPGEPVNMGESWPNGEVAMFKDPEDVFVSPRDGKPFVLGEHFDTTKNGYDHSYPVVCWERDGVEVLDVRYLEKRRQRMIATLLYNSAGPTTDDIKDDRRVVADATASAAR